MTLTTASLRRYNSRRTAPSSRGQASCLANQPKERPRCHAEGHSPVGVFANHGVAKVPFYFPE